MGGGLSENLRWSTLVSLLLLLGSPLELVVLVPELPQTLCDIYGVTSHRPQVCTSTTVTQTLMAKCKTVGEA